MNFDEDFHDVFLCLRFGFFYREDISFDLQQDLESLEICLCFWMNWIIKRVGIFL